MGVHPPQNGGIGYDPWPYGFVLTNGRALQNGFFLRSFGSPFKTNQREVPRKKERDTHTKHQPAQKDGVCVFDGNLFEDGLNGTRRKCHHFYRVGDFFK